MSVQRLFEDPDKINSSVYNQPARQNGVIIQNKTEQKKCNKAFLNSFVITRID